MQIALCEDDGIFFGGTPKNVIIVVKFDDGKTVRLPYSAEKTISALYEDLNAIAPKLNIHSVSEIEKEYLSIPETLRPLYQANNESAQVVIDKHTPKPAVDKSNVIEREDFVNLISLDPGRNKDATCDLVVGREYRVIKVISTGIVVPGTDKITQIVDGYDVVDDASQRPERTRVYPHEVRLSRKRIPPPPMERGKVEEILTCPNCTMANACVLEGSEFKGECIQCSEHISIPRIIKKCQTDKCGNDVSLFLSAGAYKGSCNKCKANMIEEATVNA